MTKPSINYGQLAERLPAIGFSPGETTEGNRLFLHRETGALIMYPDLPADEPVIPRHLGMVRVILNAYGLPIPAEFASEIQKAS